MSPLAAMTMHTGNRLAEIAFLLLVIAGVWLAADAVVPRLRLPGGRTTVAGLLIAAAGVLLIVATHWGHF